MTIKNNEKILVIAGITMTNSQYEKIAKFVREQDRKDNAVNALANYDYPENVKNYISGELLEEYAEAFSELEDYSGEDESTVIERFIRRNGNIVHPTFVSNYGTEDEIRQTVEMLGCQVEKYREMIREYHNGGPSPEDIGIMWPTLYDEEYGLVDLKYVDEIIDEEETTVNVHFIGFGGCMYYPCYEDEDGKIYFDITHGHWGRQGYDTPDLYTGAYRHPVDNNICGEPDRKVLSIIKCDEAYEAQKEA